MAQQHLDRLTSIDASFLHQEGRGVAHAHRRRAAVRGPAAGVRGLPRPRPRAAAPGPALPPEARHAAAGDRAPAVGRRSRASTSSTTSATPRCPRPGTEEQLFLLASRIASQQLDRSKPLWESWLVEGLADDRFALIFKTHHSLVDGVSGRRPGHRAVRPRARAASRRRPTLEPWQPAARALGGRAGRRPASAAMVTTTAELVDPGARRRDPARRPRWRCSATPPRASARSSGPGSTRRPRRRSTSQIGPHRRYAVVRQELADYKEVKDALGGTVNDVVLTVVSGALARWLRSRGVRTEGLEMRALVPVSVRTKDQRDTLGNQLTVMRGPLPVYIEDPVARLRVRPQGDGRAQGVKAGGRRGDAGRGQQPGAADGPGPGLAAELLHPAVQPDRHQHPRARRCRSTCSGASSRTCSRSRSCPRTTRWRSRSCPTTAGSTSGCSATTTRCPTST